MALKYLFTVLLYVRQKLTDADPRRWSSSIAVREAAMYRQTLLIALLGLTLAGCYAGPGYYESDVYTAPVYGGYYYDGGGYYDHYYRPGYPGYVIGQSHYYGVRPGGYYPHGPGSGRPGYGPGPYPGHGYMPRGDHGAGGYHPGPRPGSPGGGQHGGRSGGGSRGGGQGGHGGGGR